MMLVYQKQYTWDQNFCVPNNNHFVCNKLAELTFNWTDKQNVDFVFCAECIFYCIVVSSVDV